MATEKSHDAVGKRLSTITNMTHDSNTPFVISHFLATLTREVTGCGTYKRTEQRHGGHPKPLALSEAQIRHL